MTEKDKYKKINDIVDYLLAEAIEDDKIHKKSAMSAGKASQAVGESRYIWHLKNIKELLNSPEEND